MNYLHYSFLYLLLQNLGESVEESKNSKKKKKKKEKKRIENVDGTDTNSSTIDEYSSAFSSLQLTSADSSPVPSATGKVSLIETKKRNLQECKKDFIQNLQDFRNEIEEQIKEKEKEYASQQKNVSQMIEVQSEEMSKIINYISRAEDEIVRNDKEVENLDKEIRNHELEIKRKGKIRRKLLLKSQENTSQIKNFNEQKKMLEDKSNSELTLAKKELESQAETLNQLKHELKENIKAGEDLEGKNEKSDSNSFINFLAKSIKDKEADLECPVCMETADIPIYACQQMHLICANCRPKVESCPECREKYQDMRRHRYAEKTADELKDLKKMVKQ